MDLTVILDVSWRRRWGGAQEHLQGRCKNENGAKNRYSEECPEENPVQHLGHKLPVLYYLQEPKDSLTLYNKVPKVNRN